MIATTTCSYYKSFGLSIRSAIPLPELTEVNQSEESYDVIVEVSDINTEWSKGNQGGYFVSNNSVMFQVPDTALFCIEEGNKITVSPIKGSEEDKLRLYILGTCMGVLLMQRKVLALHGSAIAINGKAYAFIGESGAGKSTLAAAFIRKGYQLLSDDIIPVSISLEGVPYADPTYPQQKLWQESLDLFGVKNTQYQPLFDRETKFAIPVHSSFLNKPLPLAGIFELVKKDSELISLNSVKGLSRFQTLFNHTFRSSLIGRLGLVDWHFKESAKIIQEIDFYQLVRPINGFTVDELVENTLSTIIKEDLHA